MAEGLERFLEAQSGVYETALKEFRGGRKRGHWIWFIFPQLAGLGRSSTARFYGIADLAEARAYAAHPVLGPRLAACAAALLDQADDDAVRVLGAVDALKLRSSATLFRATGAPLAAPMQALLERFYAGSPCPLTLAEIA